MRYFVFIILLLTSLMAFTKEPDFSKGRRIGQPFLYKYTKNNVSSYIFGTMHRLIGVEDYPTYLTQALVNSTHFAAEAFGDYDSENKSRSKKNIPDLQVDFSALSTKALANLKKRGITESAYTDGISTFKLAVLYYYFEDFENGRQSIDKQLTNIARAIRKVMIPLDKFEHIDNVDINLSSETLNEVLESDPFLAKEGMLHHKLEMLSGDEALEEKNDSMFDDKYLTVTRNEHWIKVLRNYPNQKIFIAVGVGHLFGKYGMLELLKQEGYTIQRVRSEKDL